MKPSLCLFARGVRVDQAIRWAVASRIGIYEADASFKDVLAAIRERFHN